MTDKKESNQASEPLQRHTKAVHEKLTAINAATDYLYKTGSGTFEQRAAEIRKLTTFGLIFLLSLSILVATSVSNPKIFEINTETLTTLQYAMNAIILMLIPFLLGSLGGLTRILMSGIKLTDNLNLIITSGLMAAFSWMSIKSGILLSVVAPHLENKGISISATSDTQSDFYTMALVAILVGMFSTNLYIFVNQRVEQLVQKSKLPPEKKD
ncbi:MAG: hypothetical protein V7785_21920 [Bermanella sp.]